VSRGARNPAGTWAAPHSASSRRRNGADSWRDLCYALGWLFALVSVGRAYTEDVDVYHAVWSSFYVAEALAALLLRPWGWYTLVVGLPLHLAVNVAVGIIGIRLVGRYPDGFWFTFWLVWPALWFVYFYRRRAMFRAR
jgi:hypothetical protein